MKKILLVLAVVLSAFAASAQKTVTVTKDALTKSKSSGVYAFVLPADITTEQVEKAKGYYTQYFTVTFDETKHVATLSMIENAAKNRRVMNRFLVTLDVKTFRLDKEDKEYTFQELFDQYMN